MAGIGELTSFVLLICIIMYILSIVFNLVRAQSSYLTGSSYTYGDAIQNIVVLSVLLAAAYAVVKSNGLVEGIIGGGVSAGADNREVWINGAKAIISVLVGMGTLFVCINATWTIMQGQRDHMMGRPAQMSDMMIRIGSILVGGIFTILSVVIAQGLVDGIAAMF